MKGSAINNYPKNIDVNCDSPGQLGRIGTIQGSQFNRLAHSYFYRAKLEI